MHKSSHLCFDRERHTGSKDPLKENKICLPLKEDIICLPLKENIIWQIVGRDLKLDSILPTLQTRKTAIVAALQMKEETGSMDVCPAWILLLQKLNLLWSWMCYSRKWGITWHLGWIQRKEIVSFTHMSKTDWLHVCWLPGILNRKEVTATWCSDTEYYWNFPRDLATSKSKTQHWVVDSAEPKGASKEHLPRRSIKGTLAQKCVTSGKWWFIAKHTKTSVIAKAIKLRREYSYTPQQTQIVRK